VFPGLNDLNACRNTAFGRSKYRLVNCEVIFVVEWLLYDKISIYKSL